MSSLEPVFVRGSSFLQKRNGPQRRQNSFRGNDDNNFQFRVIYTGNLICFHRDLVVTGGSGWCHISAWRTSAFSKSSQL